MENEASCFESSEMLATFLASTPLLSESWRLCNLANANSQQIFVTEQAGRIGYVAFSAIQSFSPGDLVSLEVAGDGLFSPCQHHQDGGQGELPVLVHPGFLHNFLSVYHNPNFRSRILELARRPHGQTSCVIQRTFDQTKHPTLLLPGIIVSKSLKNMLAILEKTKSIVITGHCIGGTTASLCALWLLSYLQSISSSISILCITYGSPLLGNESLSRAILRQRWGGNFCHVVSRHDIMPRLSFAPMSPPLTQQLRALMQFWRLSMTSPCFGVLGAQFNDQSKAEIFGHVLASLEEFVQAGEGAAKSMFWPFGNYLFCSGEGAICVENAASIIKMMHLLFMSGSPSSSIDDHLKYGEYVGIVCSQFLLQRSFMPGELPQSSYEASVALALQSSGLACQEPAAVIPARDCLKLARRMGRTPNLNCANLAIKLSKITPYRAEIEWYKVTCDQSDDEMGYYDSFKQRRTSKRDFKINMNRLKLAQFWDSVIDMLESNQLPHDFHRHAKWVNASQFYKLLVEPLDIADYYRKRMHCTKGGHYITHGREKRYQIFDRWWHERTVKKEEENKRSKFASLTQDTVFWARVEEAREWLDNVRSESDPRKLVQLWENIERFERYASGLVERKEVSKDVVAKNSSYSLWVRDYKELKSQVAQLRPQFSSFIDGEVVP